MDVRDCGCRWQDRKVKARKCQSHAESEVDGRSAYRAVEESVKSGDVTCAAAKAAAPTAVARIDRGDIVKVVHSDDHQHLQVSSKYTKRRRDKRLRPLISTP